MIKGKTESGFEYKVNEDVLDDMEIIDLLSSIDEGEVQNLTKAADKILGVEQRKKLYDHIRTEDGRVPVAKFSEEFFDILGNDKLKN